MGEAMQSPDLISSSEKATQNPYKGYIGWSKGGHRQRKPPLNPCKGYGGWGKGGHRQRKPTQSPCKGYIYKC